MAVSAETSSGHRTTAMVVPNGDNGGDLGEMGLGSTKVNTL